MEWHDYAIQRTEIADAASDDYEEFVVPRIPDKISMTWSQLSQFQCPTNPGQERRKMGAHNPLEGCFVVFRKEMGNERTWVVGPVSLCSEGVEDELARGKTADIDKDSCLSWLDGKGENEVIYGSFGSLVWMSVAQLVEIAHGLESSGCSFIWVMRNVRDNERDRDWIPVGFEERISRTGKCLLIRGWASQPLILEHPSFGGFLTPCRWNLTLEGATAGVPSETFPVSAEQVPNEKLVTDVLGIGVKV